MLASVIATAAEAGHQIIDFSLDEYCDFFDLKDQSSTIRFISMSSLRNPFQRLIAKATRKVLHFIYFRYQVYSRFIPLINLFLEAIHAPSEAPFALDHPPYSKRFSQTHKVFIFGDWFTRAPTYSARHRDLVSKIFKMKPEVLTTNDRLEQQMRTDHDVMVGVVIRREDYKDFLGGRYFYSDQDYLRVMRGTQALFPDQRTVFFMCSIEPEDLSAFGEFSLHYRHGHPIENLDFLGRCDYLLTPPSTYGMWASYIAAKPLYKIENPNKVISRDDFKVVNSLDD